MNVVLPLAVLGNILQNRSDSLNEYRMKSKPHVSDDTNLHYQTEDKPEFQSLPDANALSDFAKRENTVVDITDEPTLTTNKIARTFYSCTVKINEGTYTSFYAHHSHWLYGSGGVISVTHSYLELTNPCFAENQANFGGSLALFNTDLFSVGATFKEDTAYYQGGSIFSLQDAYQPKRFINTNEDAPPIEDSIRVITQILKSNKFSECVAHEHGGAASFTRVSDLVILESVFHKCHAYHSGGALSLFDSMTYCENSVFGVCVSGKRKIELESGQYIFQQATTWSPYQRPQGGGGIMSMTRYDSTQDGLWQLHTPLIELLTQNCFFCNSYQISEADRTESNMAEMAGADILLVGRTAYRSYNDRFAFQQSQSIAQRSFTGNDAKTSVSPAMTIMNSKFSELNTESDEPTIFNNKCFYIAYTGTNEMQPQELELPSFVDSHETVSSPVHHYTADTVDPSLTDVPTTPMTKLPFKTTSSHSPAAETKTMTDSLFYLSEKRLQSLTPSVSFTPTCSTGQRFAHDVPEERTRQKEYTVYPFSWEPSQSSSYSETSTGASWPGQTGYFGTPTCSTGNHKPQPSVTASHYGEIPHPPMSDMPTFENFPSRSSSHTQTSHGRSWPAQTPSDMPELQPPLVRPTQSWYGEVPNPSATPQPTFFGIPDPTPLFTPDPSQTEIGETVVGASHTYSFVPVLSASVSSSLTQVVSYSFLLVTETIVGVDSYTISTDRYTVVKSYTETMIYEVYTQTYSYSYMTIYVPTISFEAILVITLHPLEEEAISSMMIILICLISAAIVAIIAGVVFWLVKRGNSQSDEEDEDSGPTEIDHNAKNITTEIATEIDAHMLELDPANEDDTWL